MIWFLRCNTQCIYIGRMLSYSSSYVHVLWGDVTACGQLLPHFSVAILFTVLVASIKLGMHDRVFGFGCWVGISALSSPLLTAAQQLPASATMHHLCDLSSAYVICEIS